jgi:polyisoprenoid-binding protein YceI
VSVSTEIGILPRLLILVLAAAATGASADAGELRGPARWSSPPGGSRVGFLLHTFWHGVEGTTSSVQATMQSAGGDPLIDGVVHVFVEAATLDTGNKRRDRKMRDQHLEVADHPGIEFRSTQPPRHMTPGARPAGGAPFVQVTGDLSLHGVTRPVVVAVEAEERGRGWLMRIRLSLRMSDHGITDPSILLNRVEDEVDIYMEIRLEREGG